ncbi:MAG: DUF2961 domain-containing protein, partial [Chloroflexi bacterium]|nr:DUF2961 domain-containing protein [Chloroflexota bacterium]
VNLHHNQTHVLSGGDHTASGLTVGWVIRASGATTFAWAQLQHADLGGVSTGQHRETRPFKVSKVEYQSVLAGAWHTICDFSSVGEMEYIWLAIAPSSTPSDPNCAWKYGLKITADGVLRVDTQLGNFFCSTFGSPKWTTNHVGCTYMSIANGASSHYRYVSIPFSSSLKVEVRNVSNVSCMLWAQVGWHDGTKSYPLGNKIFRTTTKLAQSVTQYASYTLVDVSPGVRGRLQGFMLAVDGNANWTFLEGNIEIWIDGTKTIEYPGTEDAFLGAFYFGQVKFQTDRAGMTKQHTRTDDTNVYQGTMYRFYLEGEEIPFNSSLKIVWYNGESGHGEPGNIVEGVYSEVWYYTES